MQIDDLTAGLSLSFLINLNTEQLQFESKILEVYPRRHTLLAEGVFTDDKIISFRGKGLVVDLIVTFPEEKPQLFKNVTTNVVKRADGTLCYTVFSVAGSKAYNRRQSYRCYVGIETAVQCGLNRAAHDAIIKDISYNGFSVVSKEDLKLEVNQTVHAVLNDHMKPPKTSTSISMDWLNGYRNWKTGCFSTAAVSTIRFRDWNNIL